MFLTKHEDVMAFAKRYDEAEVDPLYSKAKIGFVAGMDQITFQPLLTELATGYTVRLEAMEDTIVENNKGQQKA